MSSNVMRKLILFCLNMQLWPRSVSTASCRLMHPLSECLRPHLQDSHFKTRQLETSKTQLAQLAPVDEVSQRGLSQ